MSSNEHTKKFYVGDGRHRLLAAEIAGKPELRSDVITAKGHALRVLPVRELQIDPDIQFEFSLSHHRVRELAKNWDDRRAGVITVWPIEDSGLTPEEKAAIKLGLDRDRRHVGKLESFLAALISKEPQAVEIAAIVESCGYKIATTNGKSHTSGHIEAVACLERIYKMQGPDGLRRTLQLNTTWKGDPKTNGAYWLLGLALLARDGYDDFITPAVLKRWQDLVPAVVIRQAKGLALNQGSSSSSGYPEVAYHVGRAIRKGGRLKQRPVTRSRGDSHGQPI